MMEMPLLFEKVCEDNGENDLIECSEEIGNPHLKKAVTYIENNYHNAIALGNVVKVALLNHSSLTKLFRKEIGMTPIEYVWCYRIAVAKRFLAFTNLPVKDVATMCGFKTAQHFSRKFEEVCGCTPTVFRKAAASNKNTEREKV